MSGNLAGLDTWTGNMDIRNEWQRPQPGALVTPVILHDGSVVRGEVREIFTRRMRGGLLVQWFVRYANERGIMRTRCVDPTTLQRWRGYTSQGLRPNYPFGAAQTAADLVANVASRARRSVRD